MDDHDIRKYFGPALTKAEQEILYDTLQSIDRLGLRYTLYAGTLLGFVRYGEILPWDDDIDILLLEDVSIEVLRERLPSLEFTQQCRQVIKVFHEKSLMMPNDKWRHPFLDAAASYEKDGSVYHNSVWGGVDRYPKSCIFPLRRVRFGPIEVTVANDSQSACTLKYGEESLHSALPPAFSHRQQEWTGYSRERVALKEIDRVHGY